MREIRCAVVDLDHYLEEAARAKHHFDAEHWRDELRPRAMRLFTARTARLAWSRALVELIVEELFPDDLFTELVGHLDRVPSRQWPHVLAIASRCAIVGVATVWHASPDACASHCPRRTSVQSGHHTTPDHHVSDSRARLGPVKALRFASTPLGGGAHGLDGPLGRAMFQHLRDGRAAMTATRKRSTQCVNC